jgi:hypothetical protein
MTIMRKYTIELSDDIASALMDHPTQFPDGSSLPLDQKAIEAHLRVLVVLHVTRKPDPIPERAMTLLRDIAMQRAVQTSEPGESGHETKRRAEQYLEWVLGK